MLQGENANEGASGSTNPLLKHIPTHYSFRTQALWYGNEWIFMTLPLSTSQFWPCSTQPGVNDSLAPTQ